MLIQDTLKLIPKDWYKSPISLIHESFSIYQGEFGIVTEISQKGAVQSFSSN
eukprot:c14067_g1_i1 orf=2-154(-)